MLYLANCLTAVNAIGSFDHVISDPPYEESLHKSKNNKSPTRIDSGPELHGLNFSSIDEIRDEFTEKFSNKCSGWFIVFCTVEGVAKWADCINEKNIKYKRACIWVKPDSTPQLNGQGPAQGAECFVTAWCGKGHAKWNAGGKRGVYTHLTNQKDRTGLHPTEKPVSLMKEIIMDFTNPSEIILDPFMGSGTTGVACAKMGRKFIGIELNEDYFNLACERIEQAYKQPDLFIKKEKIIQNDFFS